MLTLRKPFNEKSNKEYYILRFKYYTKDFNGSELEKYLLKKNYWFTYSIVFMKEVGCYDSPLISIKVPSDKYKSMVNFLKKTKEPIKYYREEIKYF